MPTGRPLSKLSSTSRSSSRYANAPDSALSVNGRASHTTCRRLQVIIRRRRPIFSPSGSDKREQPASSARPATCATSASGHFAAGSRGLSAALRRRTSWFEGKTNELGLTGKQLAPNDPQGANVGSTHLNLGPQALVIAAGESF